MTYSVRHIVLWKAIPGVGRAGESVIALLRGDQPVQAFRTWDEARAAYRAVRS